jgi:hypothetical protein
MTIQELKARAYDLIAYKEAAQAKLNQVNRQISELTQEENRAKAEAAKADNVKSTKKTLHEKSDPDKPVK